FLDYSTLDRMGAWHCSNCRDRGGLVLVPRKSLSGRLRGDRPAVCVCNIGSGEEMAERPSEYLTGPAPDRRRISCRSTTPLGSRRRVDPWKGAARRSRGLSTPA